MFLIFGRRDRVKKLSIAIVPAFYTIFNPNNFDSNPTVFVGNFRTQFTF
ncbi:MAG: hypothetical protein ACRC2R_02715 [Xenococcaceae cyanobacterium]